MLQHRNLGDLLSNLSSKYPKKEALVFDQRRYTYEQFNNESIRLAKILLALGVCKGSRVAVLLPNTPEWLFWTFAAQKLGATVIPISTWSRTRELSYTLRHSDASILITVDRFLGNDFVEQLYELIPELKTSKPGFLYSQTFPFLRRVICLSKESYRGMQHLDEIKDLGRDLSDTMVAEASEQVSPTDIAFVLYTSGTTAVPKGVQLAHVGLINNGYHIGERQHLTDRDRLWLAVPLFWIFGCGNALMATMTHGGTIVLQEHFEPAKALELIERERCTVYYGMPSMTISLLEHKSFNRQRTRSLKKGVTIGSPRIIERTAIELGVTHICNVYGQTETYGNCTVTDANDPLSVRSKTQGKPLPNTEIRIVDTKTGKLMPVGRTGEIYVKNYFTPGYYKAEEQNEAAFDKFGFFKTGDLGFFDRNGYLHFVGRIKEMIKTAGLNVSPLEVEEVLLAHPKVRQAFVFGVPDPRREETVAAVIVTEDNADCTSDELILYCKQRIASYKVPKHIEFMHSKELPMTAGGKVIKNKLREFVMRKLGYKTGKVEIRPGIPK